MAASQHREVGREPLLLLCHRIPYPPDKGDKIRSYHLLRFLSEYFDIYLGAFVDDPADWSHVEVLREYCADCRILSRRRIPEARPLLRALLRGEPLTLPLYYRTDMSHWVSSTVERRDIRTALVFSAAMGQYVLGPQFDALRRVTDFVDVDSDKWRQYADQLPWPKSWLYRREAHSLLAFEKRLHAACDASFFVSSAEAALFRDLQPPHPARVGYFNNGVDSRFFDPALELPDPYPGAARALVFTGAMDYWPNVDAVCWFAREVFPALRSSHPDLFFYIVGSNPAPEVMRLAETDGIAVTGRVADVRPYLRHALAAVAPLRVARGIQNKVLEAMAMARPVLVSEAGLEGIPAGDGSELLLASDPENYLARVGELARGEWRDLGAAARAFVLREFSWEQNLPVVQRLLTGDDEEAAGESVAVAHG